MKLTVIHSTQNCANSSCPTIYLNEEGNYVVQGFKIQAKEKSTFTIPEGEDIIELPSEFIETFIQKQMPSKKSTQQ